MISQSGLAVEQAPLTKSASKSDRLSSQVKGKRSKRGGDALRQQSGEGAQLKRPRTSLKQVN